MRSHPGDSRAVRRRERLELSGRKEVGQLCEGSRSGFSFAAELPRFQAAVWEIFNPYELRGYVASLKPAARKQLQKLLYVSS
jgi:hypothetical protein